MKTKILITILAIFLVQTAIVSALTINIQVPASFSTGEQVSFSYSITSDINQQIIFIPHINCPNAPIGFLDQKTVNLEANVPYQDVYNDIQVTEQIEPQTCKAYIQITSPIQQKEEKSFTISTLPSFSFEIKLDKLVFLKNEDINLDYTSSVSNPEISVILTSPSDRTSNIQIPSKLNLDEIGTYIINAQASKSGYKTTQASKQIGIIESGANVQTSSPQGASNPQEKNNWIWLIILIMAIIIIIIVFLIYLLIRRSRKS